MQTAENWPFINNVIEPLADWWRRRATVRQNLADLDAFSADEMARMAQDVGLAPSELRTLAGHGPDAAAPLDRRLHAFGLSSIELAQTVPAELRDMERLCTTCDSKRRCARDLAADPYDPVWRDYCPNQRTVMALARVGIEG